MFGVLLILIIIICISFCYIFYKIQEIEKDIETLYDNYSKELEKNIKVGIKEKKKNVDSFFYNV